ncbi:MAG: ATP synthase F1 subunit gamma [Bacteroidetes bacterium]|nr:ATP synthase F1 subunit gamma [Bacteroidota bacterium]
MATLRDIRRRIVSVKSTEKITKAMKMVAVAKLRRAQEAIIQTRPYAKKMQEMLSHLATKVNVSDFSLLSEREIKNVAVVIVTSDRGLCGAFNTNLIRFASLYLKSNYSKQLASGNVKLICIGKKGAEFFTKRKYNVIAKYLGVFQNLQFNISRNIADEIINGYVREEYDKIEIIYNEARGIAQQKAVIEQYLPISSPKTQTAVTSDYIYEPSSTELITALVPKHLHFQIWKILLETNAAEQGAKMVAMDNASTNARDLIRSLQLHYNKARQASITKELLEIVGGAEALKQAS